MCDKVLKENTLKYDTKEVMLRLSNFLRTNRIIFIPTAPDDEFGHADGVVRFVNSHFGNPGDSRGRASENETRESRE